MATSTLGSGTLVLAGTTSGTTTVTATAVAGTTTLTLPAATDTLVGKATTDTLTNKTLTTPSVSSPTITGVATFAAGTAALPAITTTGDTNTGIWFPAADTIAFTEGGVESMRIDSSGNLGLGSTSISAVGSYRILDLNNTSGGYVSLSAAGTRVGAVYGAFTAVGLEAIGATNIIQFLTNGAERARFNTTGALVFNGGTTTADGIGITFPATQSASTNANTLDDYEEGTWTVTLTPSTSGTITVDSTYKTAAYTKIGRLVNCSGQITTSAVSSPVGSISLLLPFPIADLTEQAGRGTGSIFVGGSLATTINDFVLYGIEGATAVTIRLATGSQPTNNSAEKIDGSTDFVFQYTYFTD